MRLGPIMALAIVVLLAGCSGIPDSGPVRRADDAIRSPSAARFAPAGPAEGATPGQIVDGFIDAMLASPADRDIAARFLTSEAAQTWQSSGEVIVYATAQSTIEAEPGRDRRAHGTVTLDETARLDGQGRLGHVSATTTMPVELRRVDGEWRISAPPPGTLVSQRYFDDHFDAVDLFFFDESGHRLVPDTVHVVDHEQLATRLVTGLLAGTKEVPAAQARSFLPPDTSLSRAVEVSSNGVAEVRVGRSLANTSDEQRDRIAAQLAATLLQVEDVSVVRFIAPGLEFDATAGSIAAFVPPERATTVYAVSAGRLVTVAGGQVEEVGGAWAGIELAGASMSVSESADRLAAVDAEMRSTQIRALRSGHTVLTVEGERFLPPVWGPDRELWLFDRPDGRHRLRLVIGDDIRTVRADGLDGWRVETFSVSPGGVRYVMTARRRSGPVRTLLGAVRRDKEGTVLGIGAPENIVLPGASAITGVSWTTESTLSILASTDMTGPQPHEIALDGTRLGDSRSLLPTVRTSSARGLVVIGSLGKETYVEDDTGVWSISVDGLWEHIAGLSLLTRAQ